MIAGRREVVAPRELEDTGSKPLCDRNRLVLRTRVDDHDLVDKILDREQTRLEMMLFVPHDHGRRQHHRV